jgi:hypothetical protein
MDSGKPRKKESRSSPAEDVVVMRIEVDFVFLYISHKIVRAQNLGDLHKLVVVIAPVEEWFFPEDLSLLSF